MTRLMRAARVPLPDEPAELPYAGLSSEALESIRGNMARQLERAFAAATEATHKWGHSCREVQQRWRHFEAQLRQVTALTLFMTGQLKNK